MDNTKIGRWLYSFSLYPSSWSGHLHFVSLLNVDGRSNQAPIGSYNKKLGDAKNGAITPKEVSQDKARTESISKFLHHSLYFLFFIFYEEVPNVWQPTFLHFFKNNMFVFPGLYFPCFFSPSQKGKSSLWCIIIIVIKSEYILPESQS